MAIRFTRRCFHSLLIAPVLQAANQPIPLLPGNKFADVFDPEVQEQIRKRCSSNTGSGDYTFTEIPPWSRAWVNWFRNQHTDSPGKQQYIQFLKETYSYSIGDVNKAYGIDSTSFTDLGQFNWNTAKLEAPKPRKDDEEFLGGIAQVLFSTAAEAIRKADPKHRILGQQFDADTPQPVLQASAAVLSTYN